MEVKFKETDQKTIESNPILSDEKRKSLTKDCNKLACGDYALHKKSNLLKPKNTYTELNYLKGLASSFKSLRVKRKLSLRELAEKTNGSYSRICRFENLKHSPTLLSISKLAEAMDCELKIEFIEK